MRDIRITNPYVGPSAFGVEQSHLFFGREREARKLLSLLSSERVVLFYSPSGAGKTSLLNARIVTALEHKRVTVLPTARVGGDVATELAPRNVYVYNALSYLSRQNGSKTHADALLSMSISEFLETELNASEKIRPQVMIFDQFEEIIATHPERRPEREEFFQEIRQALASMPLLSVVFAMREDRIAGLDTYAPLLPDRLSTRFRMERLGRGSAIEAIRSPARAAGRPFAANVAEALADNLREERTQGGREKIAGQFVEPVQLQVVCFRLWESLRKDPGESITGENLAAFGGVDEALETFYEETIVRVARRARLSERSIRLWFQEELITSTQIRTQVNRDPVSTGGLPNRAVDVLEDHHLVRSESARGGIWYELVHDRFIDPILESNARWLKRWRKRRLVAAASMSLLTLFIFMTWTLGQNREERRRQADHLSQQALEILEENPPRALFLALEAAKSTAKVEPAARAVLRQALHGPRAKLIEVIPTRPVDLNHLVPCQQEPPRNWLGMDDRGRRLWSLDADGRLSYWDVPTNRELWTVGGDDVPIGVATLAGDGTRLATAERCGGSITVWSTETRSEMTTRTVATQPLELQFSPDGNRLVSLDQEGKASLWSLGSGQDAHSESENDVFDLAFRPGGNQIVTASVSGLVQVWGEAFDEVRLTLATDPYPVVGFSSDGLTLASVSSSGDVQVWSYGSGGPPWTRRNSELLKRNPEALQAIGVDTAGRDVFLVEDLHGVRAWDLMSGVESILLKREVRLAPAFSGDHRRLALLRARGGTEVWEVVQDVPVLLDGHQDRVNGVTFSHDGTLLASASDDLTVRIWKVGTGRESHVLRGHGDKVDDVAFRPDDEVVATAGSDGTIKLWELKNRQVVHTLSGHSEAVVAVEFDASGTLLLTASLDGTVKGWDSASGEERLTLVVREEPSVDPYSVAFHPRGSMVVTGNTDGEGQITFWNLESRQRSRQFKAHDENVSALAFNLDGSLVASTGKDSIIKVWDVASGRARAFSAQVDSVTEIAFAHDGERLASYAPKKTILWHLESGTQLLGIPSSGAILDLAFSPDGKLLATADQYGRVHLEPLDDEELIRLAEERVGLEPPLEDAR